MPRKIKKPKPRRQPKPMFEEGDYVLEKPSLDTIYYVYDALDTEIDVEGVIGRNDSNSFGVSPEDAQRHFVHATREDVLRLTLDRVTYLNDEHTRAMASLLSESDRLLGEIKT